MEDEVLAEVRDGMEKVVEAFARDMKKVRTGRANPGVLDGVRVEAYGSKMPINQVATVTVPESRLIVVQPWDQTVLSAVERAIIASDLGLMPQNDGKIIRLPIPPLTEERRKELVRGVRKRAEEAKVALRGVRREGNDMLKELEKEKEITEDDLHRLQGDVQKETDAHSTKVDGILADKEQEVMEV